MHPLIVSKIYLGILFSVVLPPIAKAQFVINEFMAHNLSSVDVDEDTQHEDWIEIQNTGNAPALLNGWYLTDDASELRKWQFPVTLPVVTVAAGARLTVWASGKNRRAVATRLHTNFKLKSEGEFLALVKPDGTTVEDGYSPTYPAQFPNGTYGRVNQTTPVTLLTESSPGRAMSPISEADFTANFIGWNTTPAFNDSTWQAGTGGFGFGPPFENEIGAGGDLTAAMKGIAPICFIRYPFNYTPSGQVTTMRLKTKFDDGYVCYLNGVLIGSNGNPTVIGWNSTALSDRPDTAAGTASTIIATNGLPALVDGPNVLSFALLNSAATELTGSPAVDTTNALLRAQLEVDYVTGFQIGYLTTATRGNVNTAIKTSVGPAINATTDWQPQPAGGADSAPLLIKTTVGTTLRPLAGADPVTLRWRRMHEAESTVVMVDNGMAGDAVAFDGTYAGSVPTTSLLPGEMIRWRIVARDNSPTPAHSYDPPYTGFSATAPPGTMPPVSATIEAEQYFGTMSIPVLAGASTLPVLHWFYTGTDNSVNNTGTRGSFFWQPLPFDPPPQGYTPPRPRFYDNVMANLHGQSSAGFPKKSHDLSFGKDNRFLWKDGTPATSGINLLTNYADKTKVRNPAAWWIWEKSGHIASHYDTLVRVQQNKVFKGVYDVVENGNAAWLQRQRLDEAGALYKMYNLLDSAFAPGAEKKNPDDTNIADLTALINGLSPSLTRTARLRYLYDNVNVPALINYLAVHSLILNRDFGHKNYYLYRDTNGTGEWSPLPWDQDLSMGHTWTNAQNYFDDDIHSQAALQIGVSSNRLIELAYTTPELNHMFVRRLRTLADQFYVSASEANGPITQFVNNLVQKLDPNPEDYAAGTDDADLEARAWGFWVDGGGGARINYTDARMPKHTVRAQAARLTTANPSPPGNGAVYDDGTTTLLPFLPGRRDFFFKAVPPTSPGLNGVTLANQTFPASQLLVPNIVIEQVTPAPATGLNQNHEYFVLRNPNNYAVDISGWTIGGDIAMTFQGGTVIPAQGATTTQATNTPYINQLIVANKPAGIRTRLSAPMANQYRMVSGPYNHQLSARGGIITLNRPNNPLDPSAGYTQVQSVPYTGTPTAHQDYLRITELNFRPAPSTAAELAALAGLVGGDFEFIELINAGSDVLDLGGASFTEGVEFTFPTSFMLNPNQRCVVVASQSAYQIRYGTSHRIAGEFQGSLNNGGETLRLLDPIGEQVLEFTYRDDWYPVPNGQYRSIVITQPPPFYADYGLHDSWQLSSQANGSPGAADAAASQVYEGWRYNFFSDDQLPTVLFPDTAASPEADSDGDGARNIEEYAFGSNPISAASNIQISHGTTTIGANTFLTITFQRSTGSIDLTYGVECSTDLQAGTWQTVALPVGDPVPLGRGMERVTYRDTAVLGAQPRRFMRATARK